MPRIKKTGENPPKRKKKTIAPTGEVEDRKLPESVRKLREEEEEAFQLFFGKMAGSHDLRDVEVGKREELLRQLYRPVRRKLRYEEWASTERADAKRFREYRTVISTTHALLMQSLLKVRRLSDAISAKQCPELAKIDELIGGQELRDLIVQAAKGIGDAIESSVQTQRQLGALVNPQLRTEAEAALVAAEIFDHTRLPLSQETPKLDLWFIGEAAHYLDKYRTEKEKKIPNYDKIIAELFLAGFDQARTEVSIRMALRRQRKSQRPALCDLL